VPAGAKAKEALPFQDEDADEDEADEATKPTSQAEASKAALAAVSARKGGAQRPPARAKGQPRGRSKKTRLSPGHLRDVIPERIECGLPLILSFSRKGRRNPRIVRCAGKTSPHPHPLAGAASKSGKLAEASLVGEDGREAAG